MSKNMLTYIIYEWPHRYFVEEADFLKGFQLINDSTDGFGGVASKISEHIQDEYGGQCLLAFPTLPSHYNETKLDAIQVFTGA
jgi:hypothetical protein